MGRHSPIGASSLKRIIECPGSVKLSLGVPVPPTSKWAAEGTAAHHLAERSVIFGEDPTSAIGESVAIEAQRITHVAVDARMAIGLSVYMREFDRLIAGATWWRQECRVCLDPYWPDIFDLPPVSAFGTADLLVYHRGRRHLDVLDYKSGSGVYVPVADNPQLLYYAAGALLLVPGPVATVTLHVVQPNIPDEDAIRRWDTAAVDVLVWTEDVLKPAIARAFAPGAERNLNPGRHCQFCAVKAANACPALDALELERARELFASAPALR